MAENSLTNGAANTAAEANQAQLNLQKVYTKDISFEVPRGQMIGFVGGNGAGKTTTMRMVMGLLALMITASNNGIDAPARDRDERLCDADSG